MENFLQYLENFQNSVPNVFITTPIDIAVRILWNLADKKSVKLCVNYLGEKTKFCLPLKLSLLQGSRPKSATAQPPTMDSEYSRFHSNRFAFGRVTAEGVNTAKSPCKVNTIFGRSLASSRIITSLTYTLHGHTNERLIWSSYCQSNISEHLNTYLSDTNIGTAVNIYVWQQSHTIWCAQPTSTAH